MMSTFNDELIHGLFMYAPALLLSHDAIVGEVMTPAPDCVGPEDDVERVERLMAERQVRRVVVVDDAGRCVGVIAQAHLAT